MGGEAGTVSSISSSAASSWSEDRTMVCKEWDVAGDAFLGMTGLPGVLVGGSSMPTPSPDCSMVAPPEGRTSPSGIGGLGRLPQRPSWNAVQR